MYMSELKLAQLQKIKSNWKDIS